MPLIALDGPLPLVVLATVLAVLVVWNVRVRRANRDLVVLQSELESRTRELGEANDAQTRFLASISHEIRTPLNGILGVNRMLLQSLGEGRERERELAEIVQAQGRALLAIINDILDYSKIEAGRFVLEPADFGLRRVINDAARVHREQAQGKGLAFVVEVDAAVPARVHGDAVRLRQVLDNLLANAVKFTERGEVGLRVRPEGHAVRFEVRDTGIGVDAATLAGLFKPFTQADTSTTRRYGGTGLGLAIAKSLVEMMGGTIGGSGAAGQGATFWIVVPLGPAQQPGGPMTPQEPRTPIYGIAPVRPRGQALLAEDNAINRMVTVALLRDAGWQVDVATNGLEAVAAFERRRYDLVLMDCRMPELDGYGAAQRIRAHEAGRTPRTPIVALTAHAVAGEADRCRAAGMDDYLTKPIGGALLARVLDEWGPRAPGDAAAAEDTEVIDASVLDDLGRRSAPLLRQLLENYVAAVPGEVAELRAVAARGDLEAARARAHDLAGTALLVGARTLARRLRSIEALDSEAAMGLLDALSAVEEEHRRVVAALAARLA